MTPLRIAITGATGMVGTALTPVLLEAGHQVIPVSRSSLVGGIQWNPAKGEINARDFDGIDAVVHLAGEDLADGRWSAERKALLRSSRIETTHLLTTALASLRVPPATLVCASAIGFYGNRGDEMLDETAEAGTGFLADLVRDWEAAAEPARRIGMRVVNTRFGLILAAKGGALAKLVPPFKLGLGGPVGDGEQWWSWVTLSDVTAALARAVADPSLSGVLNVTAPEPVRNKDFVVALGHELGRPAVIPIPAFALRMALGDMADEALLASARVLPTRLLAAQFRFQDPELKAAMHTVLHSEQPPTT